MKRIPKYLYFLLFLSGIFLGGCTEPQPIEPKSLNPQDTIGSLCQRISTNTIPVRGIGIVAGLAGTGSSECPPAVRQELEKYIQANRVATTSLKTGGDDPFFVHADADGLSTSL